MTIYQLKTWLLILSTFMIGSSLAQQRPQYQQLQTTALHSYHGNVTNMEPKFHYFRYNISSPWSHQVSWY